MGHLFHSCMCGLPGYSKSSSVNGLTGPLSSTLYRKPAPRDSICCIAGPVATSRGLWPPTPDLVVSSVINAGTLGSASAFQGWVMPGCRESCLVFLSQMLVLMGTVMLLPRPKLTPISFSSRAVGSGLQWIGYRVCLYPFETRHFVQTASLLHQYRWAQSGWFIIVWQWAS